MPIVCAIPQRMFIETNIYLLAITVVVTLLHSVFDFLAFKNGTPCLHAQYAQRHSVTPPAAQQANEWCVDCGPQIFSSGRTPSPWRV